MLGSAVCASKHVNVCRQACSCMGVSPVYSKGWGFEGGVFAGRGRGVVDALIHVAV